MNRMTFGSMALIVAGIALGMTFSAAWNQSASRPSATVRAQEQTANQNRGADDMRGDVERLKEKAPDQAHGMVSVSYHFNNLWFAGQHANWPLAQFYLNETRSHLQWAVRVIPIRKDNAGREIDLRAILQAVENSPLKQLEEAIKAEDHEKFVAAYKFTLEGCYGCHKASDKPYIRPQIPSYPADPIVNFEPLPAAEEQPPKFQVPEADKDAEGN